MESKAPHIYLNHKYLDSHRNHSQSDVQYITLLEIHSDSKTSWTAIPIFIFDIGMLWLRRLCSPPHHCAN